MRKFIPLIFLFAVIIFFFKPFFLQGKLPIPADSLVGLYYPYRDMYAATNPNGLPYKNFLITDPVRQQYPWRLLTVESFKQGTFPLWNPYNGMGEPLLGNIQSAGLYPLNILLFFIPFHYGWSVLIFLQLVLGGLWMYLYLRNRDLTEEASVFGTLSFIFSGFFVAWFTWNTLLHVFLWLPLILLAIDKIAEGKKNNTVIWCVVLILSLLFSFLAGHLQTYFYLFILSLLYAGFRLQEQKKWKMQAFVLLGSLANVIVLISPQLISTLQLIFLSARSTDQQYWQRSEGWFIPWQHIIQFVAPDFFGNPATLNYWGTWNYGEMVGYIGIIPLVFVFYALLHRQKRDTVFFGVVVVVALLFALPSGISAVPFLLKIPLLSTSQPTRLLSLIDFSLAVLAANGFDYFMRKKELKNLFMSLGIIGVVLVCLWIYLLAFSHGADTDLLNHLQVAKRNLYLPTLLLVLTGGIVALLQFVRSKKIVFFGAILLLIFITAVDLVRFDSKFNPFVSPEYLYPKNRVITFLEKKSEKYPWRFLGVDYAKDQKRIFPPNTTVPYHLMTIDDYNPLLLTSLQGYAAGSEYKTTNSDSVSFNRIIALNTYDSRLIDLAGVKYVASLGDISLPSMKYIFKVGETRVYENTKVFPRAFMVYNTIFSNTKEKTMSLLLDKKIDLHKTVIIEKRLQNTLTNHGRSSVTISDYQPNKISLSVKTDKDGILLLTDSYYPSWKARIDGKRTTILRADMAFRAIVVPKGVHAVVFYTTLF